MSTSRTENFLLSLSCVQTLADVEKLVEEGRKLIKEATDLAEIRMLKLAIMQALRKGMFNDMSSP